MARTNWLSYKNSGSFSFGDYAETIHSTVGGHNHAYGNDKRSNGKFYFELEWVNTHSDDNVIGGGSSANVYTTDFVGYTNNSFSLRSAQGDVFINGIQFDSGFIANPIAGDIQRIAIDLTDGKGHVYFALNDEWFGGRDAGNGVPDPNLSGILLGQEFEIQARLYDPDGQIKIKSCEEDFTYPIPAGYQAYSVETVPEHIPGPIVYSPELSAPPVNITFLEPNKFEATSSTWTTAVTKQAIHPEFKGKVTCQFSIDYTNGLWVDVRESIIIGITGDTSYGDYSGAYPGNLVWNSMGIWLDDQGSQFKRYQNDSLSLPSASLGASPDHNDYQITVDSEAKTYSVFLNGCSAAILNQPYDFENEYIHFAIGLKKVLVGQYAPDGIITGSGFTPCDSDSLTFEEYLDTPDLNNIPSAILKVKHSSQ